MRYDKYEYIRNYYHVPARKDAPIQYKDRHGVVTDTSGPHVMIKLNGDKHALPYHPTDEDLKWLEAPKD